MTLAVVVLTRDALRLARSIRESRGGEATIFAPSCVVGPCGGGVGSPLFATGEAGLVGWTGPLRRALPEIWAGHDAIVAVMAVGAVVRLIAPLLEDKRRDPAVLAVDEAARFAVPVCGGHGAGGNRLAREIAATLGALPVITTASESLDLPAADLIGRDLGWEIERVEDLTGLAAAIVRREPVAVFQDCGEADWWTAFGPWPESFRRVDRPDGDRARASAACIVITDRLDLAVPPLRPTVVYRPPTLVAGVGCKRGVSRETIDAHVVAQFEAHGLAIGSLSAVATVTLKRDEPGLIAFAASRRVPLIAFRPEELDAQPGIETPSERVRSKIGIASVCEAAALRAAGASHLLVPKRKGPGVTVAIARRTPGPS